MAIAGDGAAALGIAAAGVAAGVAAALALIVNHRPTRTKRLIFLRYHWQRAVGVTRRVTKQQRKSTEKERGKERYLSDFSAVLKMFSVLGPEQGPGGPGRRGGSEKVQAP